MSPQLIPPRPATQKLFHRDQIHACTSACDLVWTTACVCICVYTRISTQARLCVLVGSLHSPGGERQAPTMIVMVTERPRLCYVCICVNVRMYACMYGWISCLSPYRWLLRGQFLFACRHACVRSTYRRTHLYSLCPVPRSL